MKNILFVSKNKMLGQSLLAAVRARPALDLKWLPQLGGAAVDVYHADVVILDVLDEKLAEQTLQLCRTLRACSAAIRLLLLVRQDQPKIRALAVEAKQSGLADGFVFYDSSLDYLLAKLTAL